MKPYTTLLARFSALSNFRRGKPEQVLVHPMREWITSLTVTVIAGVVLFGFAGFDFYMQFTSTDVPPADEVSVPKYRSGDAQTIIRYYDGKESQFQSLRDDVLPAPVIPSPEPVTTPAGTGSSTDGGTL